MDDLEDTQPANNTTTQSSEQPLTDTNTDVSDYLHDVELPPATVSKRKKDGTPFMTREERAARKKAAAAKGSPEVTDVKSTASPADEKVARDEGLALMSVGVLDVVVNLISSGESPKKTAKERGDMQKIFADYYATIESTPPPWLVLLGASAAYLAPSLSTPPALNKISSIKMWILRKLGV